jgi:hypothetical protein
MTTSESTAVQRDGNDVRRIRSIARRLNSHHWKHSAGWYAPGNRFFKARCHRGQLQCSPDWGVTWVVVPPETQFTDHNGRPIPTDGE